MCDIQCSSSNLATTRSCCIVDACSSFSKLLVPSFHRAQAYSYSLTIFATQSGVYFNWQSVFECQKLYYVSLLIFGRCHVCCFLGFTFTTSNLRPRLATIFYTDSLLLTTPCATISFMPLLPGCEKKKQATELLDCPLL